MAVSLFSNWWYRVAARKPKLRSHARLHRHIYRGEVWYLLQDAASSRVHRFTPAARLVISLMDGRHSVMGSERKRGAKPRPDGRAVVGPANRDDEFVA